MFKVQLGATCLWILVASACRWGGMGPHEDLSTALFAHMDAKLNAACDDQPGWLIRSNTLFREQQMNHALLADFDFSTYVGAEVAAANAAIWTPGPLPECERAEGPSRTTCVARMHGNRSIEFVGYVRFMRAWLSEHPDDWDSQGLLALAVMNELQGGMNMYFRKPRFDLLDAAVLYNAHPEIEPPPCACITDMTPCEDSTCGHNFRWQPRDGEEMADIYSEVFEQAMEWASEAELGDEGSVWSKVVRRLVDRAGTCP